MTGEGISIGEVFTKEQEESLRKRGHANILIAGRTGVGKSTLINSVFQGNFATTGQGRPVTEHTREITKEGIPLSIFDTRGLEMADFVSTMKSLKQLISDRKRDRDEKRHIHVAWVCIAEDLRRVEEAETALVAMLADFVPVIGVLTKARSDKGFRAEVQRLLPHARNVIRVRANDLLLRKCLETKVDIFKAK
jgi:GTPase SAR1 family protein